MKAQISQRDSDNSKRKFQTLKEKAMISQREIQKLKEKAVMSQWETEKMKLKASVDRNYISEKNIQAGKQAVVSHKLHTSRQYMWFPTKRFFAARFCTTRGNPYARRWA